MDPVKMSDMPFLQGPGHKSGREHDWRYFGGGFLAVGVCVLGVGSLDVYSKSTNRPLLWTTGYAYFAYACVVVAAFCGIGAALEWPFPLASVFRSAAKSVRRLRRRFRNWLDEQNDPLPSPDVEAAASPLVTDGGQNRAALDVSGKAGLKSAVTMRELAPASRLLSTELRDIRHKIEIVRSIRPTPHYSMGFRFPTARWDEYKELLARHPRLYDSVEAAYVAAHNANEVLVMRETRTPGATLGVTTDEDLDNVYARAAEALGALAAYVSLDSSPYAGELRIGGPELLPLGEETYEIRPLRDNTLGVSFGVVNSGDETAQIDGATVDCGVLCYGRVHAPPAILPGHQARISVEFDWGGDGLMPGERLEVTIDYSGPTKSGLKLKFTAEFLATGGWHIERLRTSN